MEGVLLLTVGDIVPLLPLLQIITQEVANKKHFGGEFAGEMLKKLQGLSQCLL